MSAGLPTSNNPNTLARLYGLTWLGDQSAARWRRKDWTTQQLADELWTVMSRLQDAEPAVTEFTGEDGETIQIDERIDRIFELIEEISHEHDPVNNSTSTARTEWERASVPCQVGSKTGDQTYNVTLYPHGLAGAGVAPDDVVTIQREAYQLQIDPDETIPPGTWTMASVIGKFTTTLAQKTTDGVPGPIIQSIKTEHIATYIQVPVWL
jgi:hypothetical protein